MSDWFTMGWKCYLLVLNYKLYKCVLLMWIFGKKKQKAKPSSFIQVTSYLTFGKPKRTWTTFLVRILSDVVTIIIYHRLSWRKQRTAYCTMKMNRKNKKLLLNISFFFLFKFVMWIKFEQVDETEFPIPIMEYHERKTDWKRNPQITAQEKIPIM